VRGVLNFNGHGNSGDVKEFGGPKVSPENRTSAVTSADAAVMSADAALPNPDRPCTLGCKRVKMMFSC
jgi:hypothetical protein